MSTHSRSESTRLIVILGLFAAACAPAEQAKTEAKRSVRAATSIVRPVTITDHFQAPGTVRAKTQTLLSSKVMGQITYLKVREGDRVRPGDVLVEIEGRDINAQFRRAQAAQVEANRGLEEADGAIRASEAAVRAAETNRDLALTTQQRFAMLRERHSVSPQEFDESDARFKAAAADADRARETLNANQARRQQVLARIEQAEAEVEAARAALAYLKITSPIDGIVTEKHAEVGMLAAPGMPLLAIDDDRTFQMHSVVEESYVGIIHIGQQTDVHIDGFEVPIRSSVAEIVPASDPATRTFTVKVALTLPPEIHRVLHSGFFGRASFPTGERQTVVVPESALIQRGQLAGVYIVEEGVALFRLVKSGKRYDQGVEILSGLKPGIRILTAPGNDIADGVLIVDGNTEGSTP